jgi:methylmalonyl-CoA mutase
MNAIGPWQRPRVYMRSLATRDTGSEISAALPDVLAACKAAGFDLVIVETSGIGQGDAAIVPHVDVPMYVMTPEFGAASQLEKIDMLDFAEFVAINKFDRKGAADALRDVAKQVQRNREAFTTMPEEMPVFGTMASRFNDDGVTALYQALKPAWASWACAGRRPPAAGGHPPQHAPDAHRAAGARTRYLAEIADTVRGYKARARAAGALARELQQLREAPRMLHEADDPRKTARRTPCCAGRRSARPASDPAARQAAGAVARDAAAYAGDEYVVKIRDKEIRTGLTHHAVSGTKIRKVALPPTRTTASC